MNAAHRIAAFAFALACASTALAQSKPALVQDRDEPGRNPWQQSIDVMQNATNCGPPLINCFGTFDTVPAGKRLVVTYASAIFSGADASTPNPLVYAGPAQIPNFVHFLPLPQARGGARLIASGPVLFYVDAGTYAYMVIQADALKDGYQATMSLSGYLIDAP